MKSLKINCFLADLINLRKRHAHVAVKNYFHRFDKALIAPSTHAIALYVTAPLHNFEKPFSGKVVLELEAPI